MKKTFVKIMSLVLAFVLIASCTACSKKSSADGTGMEQSSITGDASVEKQDFKISDFLKAPAEGSELEKYRTEVNRRVKDMENDEDAMFSTPEEMKFLEANGYDLSRRGIELARYSEDYMELSMYRYPVVFVTENDSVQVWSITEYGELYIDTIIQNSSGTGYDYVGDVHYTSQSENEEVIRNERSFAVLYDTETNKITLWSLGEVICQHELPEKSVYCGFSDWVGYIFRAGTDVYALSDIGVIQANSKHMCEIKPIAHNVKMVIDADYYMGSDDWAQPLFLMTDGTVKGYCEWVGNEGAPSDDPSYLYDIRHEGGYDK